MSGAINYDDAMQSLSSMFAGLDRQQIHDVLAKHSPTPERLISYLLQMGHSILPLKNWSFSKLQAVTVPPLSPQTSMNTTLAAEYAKKLQEAEG